MRAGAVLLFTTLLIPAIPVSGQEKSDTTAADPAVYKVEFNIHDGNDAAAKAGRRYVIMIESGYKGAFRVGQKMPYLSGGSSQFNYADVGVNIDCGVNEFKGKLRLRGGIDISILVQNDKSPAPVPPPTTSQLRLEVNALVTPGKPAIVASIDDPAMLRKFDVEATVTKVN